MCLRAAIMHKRGRGEVLEKAMDDCHKHPRDRNETGRQFLPRCRPRPFSRCYVQQECETLAALHHSAGEEDSQCHCRLFPKFSILSYMATRVFSPRRFVNVFRGNTWCYQEKPSVGELGTGLATGFILLFFGFSARPCCRYADCWSSVLKFVASGSEFNLISTGKHAASGPGLLVTFLWLRRFLSIHDRSFDHAPAFWCCVEVPLHRFVRLW